MAGPDSTTPINPDDTTRWSLVASLREKIGRDPEGYANAGKMAAVLGQLAKGERLWALRVTWPGARGSISHAYLTLTDILAQVEDVMRKDPRAVVSIIPQARGAR